MSKSREYQALALLGPGTTEREWQTRLLLAHAIADKVVSRYAGEEIPTEGGAVLPAYVRRRMTMTAARRKQADKPTEWLTVHPRDPGLYWVSVEPAMRSPRPWVVLEPVFQIMITPSGDVFELGVVDGKLRFKDEPTYNTSDLPDINPNQVKYRSAAEPLPADPWPKSKARAAK